MKTSRIFVKSTLFKKYGLKPCMVNARAIKARGNIILRLSCNLQEQKNELSRNKRISEKSND